MRLLHTMLRVGDLEASIRFYCEVLGMKLLRQHDFPDGRFTLAFVGYGAESDHTAIELTHNWDTSAYTIGDAYGHIAIGVADIYATCAEITSQRREGYSRTWSHETRNDGNCLCCKIQLATKLN